MDLYPATLHVVPMMSIALFLHQRDRTRHAVHRDSATLRFFHYAVAALGLLAFSCAVFVVGAEIEPPRWTGVLITVALACAMSALAAQAFSVLARDGDQVDEQGRARRRPRDLTIPGPSRW